MDRILHRLLAFVEQLRPGSDTRDLKPLVFLPGAWSIAATSNCVAMGRSATGATAEVYLLSTDAFRAIARLPSRSGRILLFSTTCLHRQGGGESRPQEP